MEIGAGNDEASLVEVTQLDAVQRHTVLIGIRPDGHCSTKLKYLRGKDRDRPVADIGQSRKRTLKLMGVAVQATRTVCISLASTTLNTPGTGDREGTTICHVNGC